MCSNHVIRRNYMARGEMSFIPRFSTNRGVKLVAPSTSLQGWDQSARIGGEAPKITSYLPKIPIKIPKFHCPSLACFILLMSRPKTLVPKAPKAPMLLILCYWYCTATITAAAAAANTAAAFSATFTAALAAASFVAVAAAMAAGQFV